MLGDAAGLAGLDVGLPDPVQKARLAVVDVAHDRDDRRLLDEVLRVVVGRDLDRLRLLDGPDLDLDAELLGDELYLLGREGLGERLHLAQAHQDLDDLGRRHAQGVAEVLDRRPRLDPRRRRSGSSSSTGARSGSLGASRRGGATRPRGFSRSRL